jgi:DNA-damage-inducible protein D
MDNTKIALFEDYKIRRLYDEKGEIWYFSVVDIVQALIQQPDYQTARKYWNKLKERLKKEGSEVVTNCHQLKMSAEDGKLRLTDAASPETLLRLIQSVRSGPASRSKSTRPLRD